MRQSLAQLERAFVEEIHQDRDRRESLRRAAAHRARVRRVQRETKRSSFRFALLSLTLIATAVIVTVAMFKALYLVMG
ncbi:MAG: hypothetical protein LC720_08750 [Actinobacteria bacterium]|nr:hypothetical protein [Actinomycetota bacterium]